ncbi:hypothetical protein FACS1894172_15280 [Spirochaetia bacterium]|nr:hypothetical protein FACS1894164_04030 [Spirochaetia bacterium]GHU34669.1 hypothetical protein FACS1894172_15280 [Spirochaetia bacterium]
MQVKSYKELYKQMTDYVIAHQEEVTDFNAGSVIASFIEAVSIELTTLYIRCNVGFVTYLKNVPMSMFDFKKNEGTRASGFVVFSREKSVAFDTGIPRATLIGSGELIFSTSHDAIIPAGLLNSLPVPISATNVGHTYNVSSKSINEIKSTVSSGIVAVNNDNATTGGTDGETWSQYLERFSDFILGLQRTNKYGFESVLRKSDLVNSYYIQENFPPKAGLWNITLYLEDGTGTISPESVQKISDSIDGNNSGNENGYRSPGINIEYRAPDIFLIDVFVTIYVAYDVNLDKIEHSVMIQIVENQIKEFINTFPIGKSYLKSDLIVEIKKTSFVRDVEVQSPYENMEIQANQILRIRNYLVSIGA